MCIRDSATSAFSWGASLNATEDNSNGTVTVTTTGVEDGQTLTITLNGSTYTGSVSSNSASVTITAAGLQGLTNGSSYTMTADVDDAAGNSATQVTSSSFSVDTSENTVSSFTMSDTSLIVGETATVTLVFSEAVASFSSGDDITVQNGSLSTMTSSDNITWTGTFTPTDDIEDSSNVLTLATSYTDTAGNTGAGATTANYAIDTKEPT